MPQTAAPSPWASLTQLPALMREAEAFADRFVSCLRPRLRDAAIMRPLAAIVDGWHSEAGGEKGCGVGRALLGVSVLLAYYSPRSLSGWRVPRALRGRIARAVGCPAGYVSKKKDCILFLYAHDTAFRTALDAVSHRTEAYLALLEAGGTAGQHPPDPPQAE